jgi:hypothetical protein
METAHALALPPFRRYANLSGHSGVVGYALVGAGIAVRFVDGSVYLYDRDCPGQLHVARMKALARAGSGLATYISRRVGRRYAARLDSDEALESFVARRRHQTRQKMAFR